MLDKTGKQSRRITSTTRWIVKKLMSIAPLPCEFVQFFFERNFWWEKRWQI